MRSTTRLEVGTSYASTFTAPSAAVPVPATLAPNHSNPPGPNDARGAWNQHHAPGPISTSAPPPNPQERRKASGASGCGVDAGMR
ncbi:MAG: hypothetical protein R2701_10495 [Acidimicrobiales bacterium]